MLINNLPSGLPLPFSILIPRVGESRFEGPECSDGHEIRILDSDGRLRYRSTPPKLGMAEDDTLLILRQSELYGIMCMLKDPDFLKNNRSFSESDIENILLRMQAFLAEFHCRVQQGNEEDRLVAMNYRLEVNWIMDHIYTYTRTGTMDVRKLLEHQRQTPVDDQGNLTLGDVISMANRVALYPERHPEVKASLVKKLGTGKLVGWRGQCRHNAQSLIPDVGKATAASRGFRLVTREEGSPHEAAPLRRHQQTRKPRPKLGLIEGGRIDERPRDEDSDPIL